MATEDFLDTPGRWTGEVLGSFPGWETGVQEMTWPAGVVGQG